MNNKGMKPGLKIFLIAILVTFVLCGMMAVSGITVYKQFFSAAASEQPKEEGTEEAPEGEGAETTPQEIPFSKTVAIFGSDQSGHLTDVILVAHFESETNEVKVLSVPRDTKVTWSEEQRALLPPANNWVKESKINEMTSWGGMENIKGLTINQLEQMLGVKIDNYILVDLAAFRKIVDAIGGVEVEVKQRMKKDDFAQNLHIDLYPGLQLLDGEKAEQFVRFRGYPEGDVGRVEAQQQFLKAFADQVLSPSIVTKIPEIVSIVFGSLKTDVSFTDLASYYPYLKTFSTSNLQFYTVPGEGRYENNISFYFIDEEALIEQVNEIFFNK